MKRGAVLYLVLTNKEDLVGNVKLKGGEHGCSDHEIVEFKISLCGLKPHQFICRAENLLLV